MKNPPIIILICLMVVAARASNLDTVGATLLRVTTTNLDGSGVRVAQPEAGYDLGTNWEVNPSAVGRPNGYLTYISANGSTTNFPNSLSSESGHADSVGQIFYGNSSGIATNIAHVDNYDANAFVKAFSVAGNLIVQLPATNINDPVVNQSFIFTGVTTNEQQTIDSAYDNYAAQYSTLFISGIGNGGAVNPPGTCYNGIGVGVSDSSSSIGPTLDNGRCKPDIIAPGGATSFSTPLVAGASVVLRQAGLRGDGGSDTNSASDLRTLKALLLNGSIKPVGWTNSNSSPLDARYGAGVLNVFNSYKQLSGGKNNFITAATIPTGNAHPPTGNLGAVGVSSGWDFNTIASDSLNDAVNHYYFNVTNVTPNANFTATITLVWNRQQNQTDINNLNLFLYNCANSNLVTCSTSRVDNVQHIYIPKLAQGRYDLQVWKAAGTPGVNIVSSSETYALAWEFFAPTLNMTNAGTNPSLIWPVYPAGFVVETTTNLTASNWSTNNLFIPAISNGQNTISLNPTNSNQFFRLRRP